MLVSREDNGTGRQNPEAGSFAMVYFDILTCLCVKLWSLFICEQFRIQTTCAVKSCKGHFSSENKTKKAQLVLIVSMAGPSELH